MIETKKFTLDNKPNIQEKNDIVEFLFKNLDQFGDPKSDITKAIDYALNETPSFGGFVLVSYEASEISCVVVINQTGMKDYIPENILVYIATHREMRGKGIGKFLMKEALEQSQGSVALHVEPNNPARFLYEKLGFTSKYIEMRYKRFSNPN